MQPIVSRVPSPVQIVVESLELHELRVSAALGDAPVVQHADDVGVAHRAEAVRDHHARAPRLRRVQRLLYHLFKRDISF